MVRSKKELRFLYWKFGQKSFLIYALFWRVKRERKLVKINFFFSIKKQAENEKFCLYFFFTSWKIKTMFHQALNLLTYLKFLNNDLQYLYNICMKMYIRCIIFQKNDVYMVEEKACIRTDDYSHNILWSWQANPFGAKTFFFQWFTRWKLFWQIIDKMLPPPPPSSVCNQSIWQKVVTWEYWFDRKNGSSHF